MAGLAGKVFKSCKSSPSVYFTVRNKLCGGKINRNDKQKTG